MRPSALVRRNLIVSELGTFLSSIHTLSLCRSFSDTVGASEVALETARASLCFKPLQRSPNLGPTLFYSQLAVSPDVNTRGPTGGRRSRPAEDARSGDT
jgi:hypothetical protein